MLTLWLKILRVCYVLTLTTSKIFCKNKNKQLFITVGTTLLFFTWYYDVIKNSSSKVTTSFKLHLILEFFSSNQNCTFLSQLFQNPACLRQLLTCHAGNPVAAQLTYYHAPLLFISKQNKQLIWPSRWGKWMLKSTENCWKMPLYCQFSQSVYEKLPSRQLTSANHHY